MVVHLCGKVKDYESIQCFNHDRCKLTKSKLYYFCCARCKFNESNKSVRDKTGCTRFCIHDFKKDGSCKYKVETTLVEILLELI